MLLHIWSLGDFGDFSAAFAKLAVVAILRWYMLYLLSYLVRDIYEEKTTLLITGKHRHYYKVVVDAVVVEDLSSSALPIFQQSTDLYLVVLVLRSRTPRPRGRSQTHRRSRHKNGNSLRVEPPEAELRQPLPSFF